MIDVFNSKDHDIDSTMKLLMTKLSNHNNISVLIVCHELYPKGPNSVLLRGQLNGIYLHIVVDNRKACNYIHNYLVDKDEKEHFHNLYKQYAVNVKYTTERKGRQGILVKFTSSIK